MSNATTSDSMILELATTVQQLARRVESLEAARSDGAMSESDGRLMAAAQTVRSSTEALFGQEVVLEQRQDPEIDERYTVVRVVARDRPNEISARYREWHRRLGEWAQGLESHFRLAVEIQLHSGAST
jgi:hypothetical protein